MADQRRSSSRPTGRRRRRRRRRRNRFLPVLIVALFIIIVLAVTVGAFLVHKYSLSDEKADLKTYFNLAADDDLAVMIEDERIELNGKRIEGVTYLNIETVQDYLNSRFYWDSNENLLIYALPTELVEAELGSSEYTIGSSKQNAGYQIVKSEGDLTYVAIDFVQQYSDFEYAYYEDPNRVQIKNKWGEVSVVTLKSKESVRRQAGIKSAILTTCAKGTKLYTMETEEGIEDWSKVRTEDGFIGYVRTKTLGTASVENQVSSRNYQEPEFTSISKDYTINLVWHNVTVPEANSTIYSALASTKGLTTISPTWFEIGDNEGNLDSIASTDYVNYVHQNGMEVWGCVDNFKDGVSTFEVLSSTSKRENLTNQLIAAAMQYNLDGINVDFENLSVDTGKHFIQFIRELSIKCRLNNIILSVDNYVPKAYSAHYYRGEQGVFADYVIIMGYDEHYAGSVESGSVASIGFVREGIEKTLAEVPASKVINAIPLYTRIWKETPKTEEEIADEDTTAVDYVFYPNHVSSEADGMGVAWDAVERNGATAVWDEECAQYYAEYERDGVLYRVWLEDSASLEEKLKLMKEFNLAGVAEWKLGQETPDIWDLILKYVN